MSDMDEIAAIIESLAAAADGEGGEAPFGATSSTSDGDIPLSVELMGVRGSDDVVG